MHARNTEDACTRVSSCYAMTGLCLLQQRLTAVVVVAVVRLGRLARAAAHVASVEQGPALAGVVLQNTERRCVMHV